MKRVEILGDAVSAAVQAKVAYGAGFAAWVGSLGVLGKAGFALGLVSPPVGLLVGSIWVGAATFGWSIARRALASGKDT